MTQRKMADQNYNIVLTAADQTKAAFESANRSIESMSGGLISLKGILETVSAVAVVEFIKGSIEAADKLDQLSKTTTLSVEQLSGLKLAAAESGTNLDDVAKSIDKLSKNMGLNAEKYAALGINSTDKLEAYKQFADVFNNIADVHQRDAFAAAALGKSWETTAPLLAEGSSAIGEMVDKGEKLSGTTKETTEQAHQFNARLAELHATSEGFANQLLGRLLPSLNGISQAVLDVRTNEDSMRQTSEVLSGIINTLTSAALGAAHVFSQVGMAIGAVAAAAVAAAHGEFSEAVNIMKTNTADLEKSDAEFAVRIEKIWSGVAESKAKAVEPPVKTNVDVSDFLGRNQDNSKELADKTKHIADMLAQEQTYFARLNAMANDAGSSNIKREQLRYDREVIDLQKRRKLMENDMTLSAADKANLEKGFDQAELDLKTVHEVQLRQLKDDSDRMMVGGQVQWQRVSLDSMSAFFGMAKGLMNSHSYAMFEIGKAAAISETVINTYASATAAYKSMASIPFVGPALGIAAAAAAIASGLAQVSAIQSTSFGGAASGGGSYGGATSGLSGGQATPAYPSTPAAAAVAPAAPAAAPAAPNIVNIMVANTYGNLYEFARQLVPAINAVQGDGTIINVVQA